MVQEFIAISLIPWGIVRRGNLQIYGYLPFFVPLFNGAGSRFLLPGKAVFVIPCAMK